MAIGEHPGPVVPESIELTIEQRLRALGGSFFDAIRQSGMAAIVTGPLADDCPMVFVNDAFCRLTGYAA